MNSISHRVQFGSVVRELPIREVAPGVRVALFDILGDWQLIEALGAHLVKLIPSNVEVLVMPDGKAQALLHEMGRRSGLRTIVARKKRKPYMAEPVVSVSVKSITTDQVQELFLGADDADFLKGKNVAVVDDVVSTGGTLKAMKVLLDRVGANQVAVMAAFTEGDRRNDVIALDHLPLF